MHSSHKVFFRLQAESKRMLQNLPLIGAVYMLRAMIYQGSDFGSTGTQSSSRGSGMKYSLRVNIGPHEVKRE